MPFKIQRTRGAGLCPTCRNAQIVEHANSRATTLCHSRDSFGGRPVLRPVTACSDYDDASTPAEWELQKIAWTVTTDKSGQAIGFKPPSKD